MAGFCKYCGCAKNECECDDRSNPNYQDLNIKKLNKKEYSDEFNDRVKRAEEKISKQIGIPVKLGDRKYSASIILAMMDDDE